MSADDPVDSIFEAFFQAEGEKAPKPHRLAKPARPPLGRILYALEHGWPSEEWGQVADYEFAAKTAAIRFNLSHPSLQRTIEHLALLGQTEALKAHTDTCWQCRLLLQSRVVSWVRDKMLCPG